MCLPGFQPGEKGSNPLRGTMISIIAAMSDNRVIGKDGKIPWRCPSDLQRFKRFTHGHYVVMGRKTFESVPRLKGRKVVVVTRNRGYEPVHAETVSSFERVLTLPERVEEVFIAGGAEIYREALRYADRMYLTIVPGEYEGDTFFPEYDAGEWKQYMRYNGVDHRFVVLNRIWKLRTGRPPAANTGFVSGDAAD